jgi:hypothetical protein
MRMVAKLKQAEEGEKPVRGDGADGAQNSPLG